MNPWIIVAIVFLLKDERPPPPVAPPVVPPPLPVDTRRPQYQTTEKSDLDRALDIGGQLLDFGIKVVGVVGRSGNDSGSGLGGSDQTIYNGGPVEGPQASPAGGANIIDPGLPGFLPGYSGGSATTP